MNNRMCLPTVSDLPSPPPASCASLLHLPSLPTAACFSQPPPFTFYRCRCLPTAYHLFIPQPVPLHHLPSHPAAAGASHLQIILSLIIYIITSIFQYFELYLHFPKFSSCHFLWTLLWVSIEVFLTSMVQLVWSLIPSWLLRISCFTMKKISKF